MNANKWSRVGLAVLALIYVSGCSSITRDMWARADNPSLYFTGIEKKFIMSGDHRALLARYGGTGEGVPAHLIIPLASNDAPEAPLELSRAELECLPNSAQIDKKRVFGAYRLIQPAASSPNGTSPGHSYGYRGQAIGNDLYFVAYCLRAPDQVEEPLYTGDFDSATHEPTIPHDYHIALVPQRIPRPKEEIDAAKAQAAFATPLTLVVDLASPIWFPFYAYAELQSIH